MKLEIEYIQAALWLKEVETYANAEMIRKRWTLRPKDHEIIKMLVAAREREQAIFNQLEMIYDRIGCLRTDQRRIEQ